MTAEFDAWEQHAQWWQDGYTDGADPEYVEQLIPIACEWLAGFVRVLDLGCGEGQVARALAAQGAEVVGIDPTPSQIHTAKLRGGGPEYFRAEASATGLDDESMDAVVACLVFEHITALDAALDEVARVLRPHGRFVLLLNHPLTQAPGSAWIDDHIMGEQYYRIGPYLDTAMWTEEIAAGVHLPYVHRPFSEYINGLADRGFVVERILEPAPAASYLAAAEEYANTASIPRVLGIISRRAS